MHSQVKAPDSQAIAADIAKICEVYKPILTDENLLRAFSMISGTPPLTNPILETFRTNINAIFYAHNVGFVDFVGYWLLLFAFDDMLRDKQVKTHALQHWKVYLQELGYTHNHVRDYVDLIKLFMKELKAAGVPEQVFITQL